MADTLANDVREHAEALAMLIAGGFVPPREALDWACELVAAQAEPSEGLLELAGAVQPHPLDVMRMLRALAQPVDGERAFSRVAARLRQFLQEQPEAWPRVARDLEIMARCGAVPDRVSGECEGLADELYLAEEGHYGTLESARAELLAFLEKEAGLADARSPSSE